MINGSTSLHDFYFQVDWWKATLIVLIVVLLAAFITAFINSKRK